MQLIPRKDRGQFLSPFERFFEDPFWNLPTMFSSIQQGMFMPKIDLSETDTEIEVTADVPGYEKENIEVGVEEGILTISGKMQQEQEEKKKKYYCKQCSSGSFCQRIALPAEAQDEKAKCRMKNGKLMISIPKNKAVDGKKGRMLPIE